MSELLIKATNLQMTLGTSTVLEDVDFSVARGEMVSVMGPSGSGKSTLLHVLAGILTPDAGAVWIDGVRIDQLSEARRSRIRLAQMGFVFQFGDLIPELTLGENVRLPLQLLGLRRAEVVRRASATLQQLGIGAVADKSVAEVSGGQAQRAAVARAIVHRPSVVFADEPTGALDSVAGEGVLDALAELADSGTAVVLVTHDARVASYADRNVTLRDGRVRTAVGSGA